MSKRSVFAHAIHLDPEKLTDLRDKPASVSFCLSSNLFLGSGLLDIRKIEHHDNAIRLGSNVGAYIGRLAPDYEAELEEKLAMMMFGDDRNIIAIYVNGKTEVY